AYSPGSRQPYVLLEPELDCFREIHSFANQFGPDCAYLCEIFEKYTHLQIDLIFTRDSTETLVYNNLQPKVLHTGRLMFHLARYSRYRSIFSQRNLLIRLLKTLRQPTPSWSSSGRRSPRVSVMFYLTFYFLRAMVRPDWRVSRSSQPGQLLGRRSMCRAHQSHRSSVNAFACSEVTFQMRPTCVSGVVVTRSHRMSDVRGSNPGTGIGYALLRNLSQVLPLGVDGLTGIITPEHEHGRSRESGVTMNRKTTLQVRWARSSSFRQPYVLLEPKLSKYTHLQINLVLTGEFFLFMMFLN
ncbi:LOW QUALITY PROTEIN: hypothetical protein T265_15285, partial [Opisthorchis viverrini]